MYVDESVLNFMNQKSEETSLLTNETIDATVAFIDITGFTKITEQETPDVVVALLNRYFDVISKEVIKHGGYVDKYIGDEVMAVFKSEHHLNKAIDACLAIRKAIESLPQAIEGKYHPKVSIGVNSGEMISGNIGSEDLKRLDYTVIGDVVNVAKRMQATAREAQIIIQESCYLKIKEAFNFKKIGEVTLKNKAIPVVVYEVLD